MSLQTRSLFPSSSHFAHFLTFLDPNVPYFVPEPFVLSPNSTPLNTNDAICCPVAQFSSQVLWNRRQFLPHAPNSLQVKRNLPQLLPNVSQFAPTHRNLTQCASIHLKDVNKYPVIAPIVSKCAELIVDHTFASYIPFNSLQSSSNQLQLRFNGLDCLQTSLMHPLSPSIC